MHTNKVYLKREINDYKKRVAMKCLDCVCCQAKEILRCQVESCPLWEVRPKELKGVYVLIKELKRKNLGFYEAEK